MDTPGVNPANIMQEITYLAKADCFTMSSRVNEDFDFPLHYHREYELNLVLNAKGARRIVGDNVEVVCDTELVFMGPDIYHGWFKHQCTSELIKMVIIKFHNDLFDDTFLARNQASFLKNMFSNAQRGILFPVSTAQNIVEHILNLEHKDKFEGVLQLLSILHSLSLSSNVKFLSTPGFSKRQVNSKSRRIDKVFEHMNNNYDKRVTLGEVAKIAGMPQASFGRFIKKRIGKTFIGSLIELRLGHASRMLIDSTKTVSEIAYKCGFNNISNFNRIFKRKKFCTPKEFREIYGYRKLQYVK